MRKKRQCLPTGGTYLILEQPLPDLVSVRDSIFIFKVYTVRLESSLSKATYEFTQPEIDLTANISYKHITFKFDPKVRINTARNTTCGQYINVSHSDLSQR